MADRYKINMFPICRQPQKTNSSHLVQVIKIMFSIHLLAVLTIFVALLGIDRHTLVDATSRPAIESHDEEQLRNPLVFDPNTLYEDKTRLAAGVDLLRADTRRFKRSTSSSSKTSAANQQEQSTATQQLVDACLSKVELLTPYYATNSKGKLRTVVNSALMQQAIQVETCVRQVNPPNL